MAGSWDRLSPKAAAPVGLHAVDLLVRGTCGGVVYPDRSASPSGRCGVVRLRMWIEHGFEQFKSTGLGLAKDPDRGPRSRQPDVAGIALATFWVVAAGPARS